jgi:ubiquinone biosynthesis protein COQ9
MIPYSAVWVEAMRIGLYPKNLSNTTLILWNTFDNIWKLSGEQEFDLFYPLKRSSFALIYFRTEVGILRNPEKTEEQWSNLESQLIRSFQLGTITSNLYEISSFIVSTNYRILQSFYPEPVNHKNPINK